jgi:hypothetical protein
VLLRYRYHLPRLLDETLNVEDSLRGDKIIRTTKGSVAVGSSELMRPALADVLKQAIGRSRDELLARSPVRHASSIRAKVLLIHQENDRHVPYFQLKLMTDALSTARNAAATQTIGVGPDMGYFTPATRVPVYSRMLEFMDRNTRGDAKQERDARRPGGGPR